MGTAASVSAAPAPRIRVLLMVRNLGIGGTERQTAATALALDRRVFEPHIAAFHADGFRAEEVRAAGIPVFHIPLSSFQSPSAIRGAVALGRYIERNRIDLVHAFDTPMNIFGTLVARLFRTPVVLSSQRAYRDLMGPLARRLLRLTDRVVDGVVVNCRAVERHMADGERNPASRTEVCHNGIDRRVFCPGDSPRPTALAGPGLTVGVVCSIRPEKDLDTLLRAFHIFRRSHALARLAIVGSGPCLEGLERLASELDLTGACHFEPATSDVTRWLRALDIFVLPSRSEALSNSLMEAMACGCCPVASDVGGNPELITPMETGLLFHPGDAAELAQRLNLLARDEDMRRSLGARAALRIARDFSLEAAGKRMGEIYLSFLRAR